MKSNPKNKNITIFQANDSTETYNSNRKGRADTTQKIEGIELPAIASRHNRRITV